MPPNIEKDVCKMNIDLWMHQNTLMFSRLQTLWFIQVGFLALAGYLSNPQTISAIPHSPANELASLSKFVALMCAISTFGLWAILRTDRLLRNIYRIRIEELDLDFFPGSLEQKSYEQDYGTKLVEPLFYYFLFLVFIAIDLYAARHFGLDAWILYIATGALALISVTIPVAEYLIAKKRISELESESAA